jgi:DeoR family fructose operon transcriptional repressor
LLFSVRYGNIIVIRSIIVNIALVNRVFSTVFDRFYDRFINMMNFEVSCMPFYEREERILNALLEKETLSVQELSHKLYVSVPTLRRDLVKLESMGKIIRTHGGARIRKSAADKQIPLSLREMEQNTAKDTIGKKAAELIKDGDIIMLDASTTVYSMIPYLSDFRDLIVITSSAKASYLLGQMGVNNICTGGRMLNHSFAYIGEDAERTIRNYNADIAFFSCRCISADGRLTDKSIEENILRKAMMQQSKRNILLCDSSKFDHIFLNTLCHVSELDQVICEAPLPQSILQAMKK